MKQIKPILATILLLLLITSISYGWSPPDMNGPIAIDKVDGHPWGGTLASCSDVSPDKAACSISDNNSIIFESRASGGILLIFSHIRVGAFGNICIIINWNEVSSEDARDCNRKPKLD